MLTEKLVCPFCGAGKSRVMSSRPSTRGDCIVRRRECDECHDRYSTREILFAAQKRQRPTTSGSTTFS